MAHLFFSLLLVLTNFASLDVHAFSFERASFRTLENKFMRMELIPTLLGVRFQASVKSMPVDCANVTDPLFMSAFVISDISNEDYYIRANKCLKKEKKHKAVISFGPLRIPLTEQEKETIEKEWSELKAREKRFAAYEQVEKLKDEEGVFLKASKLLKELQGGDGLLDLICMAKLHSIVGNLGAMEHYLKIFLETNPFEYVLRQRFPSNRKEQGLRLLSALLESLHHSHRRNIFVKAVMHKVYELSGPQSKQRLSSLFTYGFNFKETNELENSPYLKLLYLSSWSWIAAREKTFSTSHLADFNDFKGLSLSEKALIFHYIKNEEWKKLSSNGAKAPSLPLFVERRNFYRKNVESGNAALFSLYQLYLLGDIQRSYFIRFLAFHTYGLPSAQILPF